MDLLGTIEPTSDSSAGNSEWIALIGTHPSLAPIPPHQGINPFTKGQMQYKARPDSAQILVNGSKVGFITWAEDDSQLLVAWTNAGAEAQVANIAAEIAACLGWKFLPSSAA
jgi:hypothetical protein